MIDTITLRLNESQFTILEHNKFSPNSYGLFNPPYTRLGSRGYVDCYQNPTQKELKEGNYKPQLTLRKAWRKYSPEIFLYIQFSAPKLLYNNNFDELSNEDFEQIVEILKDKLTSMSVITNKETIMRSQVVKIHYSKNIILPEFVIPYMIIKEVKKVDFDLRYDLAEKDYINSGASLRFHTKEFEFILYDKKKDLEKAKEGQKTIETDSTIQLGLFDILKPKQYFEVLRLEARLNTVQKTKSELSIDTKDMTFQKLFKEQLSLKVLNKYWNIIMQNYNILNYNIEDKEKFLASFMINNPGSKISNALSVYAFIEYVKDLGIRRFRRLMEQRYSRRSWYGLKAKLDTYNLQSIPSRQLEYISKYLSKYKPLYLKDFQKDIESFSK